MHFQKEKKNERKGKETKRKTKIGGKKEKNRTEN